MCKKCDGKGFVYTGETPNEYDGNQYYCPVCYKVCGIQGHWSEKTGYNCSKKPCECSKEGNNGKENNLKT